MKILSTEEAKKMYLDGFEIWYYIEGDFEVADEEELELDRQMNNTIFLEDEAKSGVAQMTCIGMETQGDDEEDFNEDQTYFSEEEYYYMIHPVFAHQFLEYYDADDWSGMVEAMGDWELEERVDIFVASNKLIDGYKEITCYSAMMLKSVGMEPTVSLEKIYSVITYDTEPIAIIEANSLEEMGKLMTEAISEHLAEKCTIIDWEDNCRVRFNYVSDDDITTYDSFVFYVLPKYKSDES